MSVGPSADQVRLLTTPAEPWLSCDDCFHLMDVVVDQLVATSRPVEELPRLRAHLRACPACAEEVDSLLELTCDDARVDSAPARAALGLGDGALPR
ncbi:MAG TPA: hypothetical protein VFL94_04900 [Actinomycetales bacterium]|nr:hypothetical protein [Actinomycetales bacterium]